MLSIGPVTGALLLQEKVEDQHQQWAQDPAPGDLTGNSCGAANNNCSFIEAWAYG